VQMRKTGTYVGSKESIKHVQETLHLFSSFSKDQRFENVLQETSESVADEKEIKNMCDVLDRIQERGRMEGRMEGRKEGTVLFASLMQKLFADGRIEDARRASEDYEYSQKLFKEYALIQ